MRRSRLRGTQIPKFIRVTVKVLIQNGFLYVLRWPRRSKGAGDRGAGEGYSFKWLIQVEVYERAGKSII